MLYGVMAPTGQSASGSPMKAWMINPQLIISRVTVEHRSLRIGGNSVSGT